MNPFNINNNNNVNFPQLNQQQLNLVNMFKQSGNPMQMIYAMVGQNPQLQPLIQMVQNGGNPEQMVRQICRERNINVDEFMKQFR